MKKSKTNIPQTWPDFFSRGKIVICLFMQQLSTNQNISIIIQTQFCPKKFAFIFNLCYFVVVSFSRQNC